MGSSPPIILVVILVMIILMIDYQHGIQPSYSGQSKRRDRTALQAAWTSDFYETIFFFGKAIILFSDDHIIDSLEQVRMFDTENLFVKESEYYSMFGKVRNKQMISIGIWMHSFQVASTCI